MEFADAELSEETHYTNNKRRRTRVSTDKISIMPGIENVTPVSNIVIEESTKENDGDGEDVEQSEVTSGEDSEWEVSDFNYSNDSGSDNEWAP